MPSEDLTDGLTPAQRHARALLSLKETGRVGLPGHDSWTWRNVRQRIDRDQSLTDDERAGLVAEWESVGEARGWLDQDLADALDDVEQFTDAVEPEIEVLQDSVGDKPLRLRLFLTQANRLNGNRRIYPRDVLADAVERARKRLQASQRRPCMEAPHPAPIFDGMRVVGFEENDDRAVSRTDDIFMRGNKVFVDTTFLDTKQGREVVEAFRSGKRTPVSLRAMGTTKQATLNGQAVSIATHLTIHGPCGDWVPNPALLEAGPSEVLTDSQIAEALADSAMKETNVNEIERLQAQIQALTDAKDADASVIADLKKQLSELTAKLTNTELTDAMSKQIADMGAQIKALTDAADAKKTADIKAAEQAKVSAFVDAIADRPEVKALPLEMRDVVAKRVGRAESLPAAEQILTDAVEDANQTIAAAKLAAQGYRQNAGGTGRTGTVEVTDSARPWQGVVDKMNQAFDDHARMSGARRDQSLAAANKPFVDQLVKEIETRDGRALTDSAAALADDAMTDSTTVANLWNQPTILMALLVQQFQFQEALQYVGGVGPQGFEQTPRSDGTMGSVLRVPVEYFTAPSGDINGSAMLVGENVAIPEIVVNTNWLSFAPAWRKAAFSLSIEAEKALLNGPLNYQAWARHMFHLTQYKARAIDAALYEEMLLASSEYGAVAVTTEAVAAAEFTYSSGGSVGGYGTNVHATAQLLCGGVTTAPNTLTPVVRPRTITDLNAAGQVTTTTRNPITIADIDSVPQVMGYMDANGSIQSYPGTTATFAIDWHNGVALFKAVGVSGADASNRPTISYTYETNFDTFNITSPSLHYGETIDSYYGKLLQQLDTTAAGMGSSPRYVTPDVAIMSLKVATYIQNAKTFYQWVSPEGSRLTAPQITSNSKFGERSGVELAKINTPWSAGDRRILMQRNRSTKYGIDTPFEIEGPYPKYDQATGAIVAGKIAYGRENSVICTPQVTNQSGTVLNPVSRTIILR